MQAQVVVQAAGAALLCPDHDQVRQRAGSRRALSVGAAAASGRALVGVASGDAMVPAEDSIALGGYKQRSPFRAAERLLVRFRASSAGARGGGAAPLQHPRGRADLARRERVTEARPARQDQRQAPAPELRVVAARELRLALAQAPARARRPCRPAQTSPIASESVTTQHTLERLLGAGSARPGLAALVGAEGEDERARSWEGERLVDEARDRLGNACGRIPRRGRRGHVGRTVAGSIAERWIPHAMRGQSVSRRFSECRDPPGGLAGPIVRAQLLESLAHCPRGGQRRGARRGGPRCVRPEGRPPPAPPPRSPHIARGRPGRRSRAASARTAPGRRTATSSWKAL